MPIDRRDFFKMSAITGAAVTLPIAACTGKMPRPVTTAVLKPSCQDGIAPGETIVAKLDFIEKCGFVAVEIGGRGLADRIGEYQNALRGRSLQVSAICAGFTGVPISDKEEERKEFVRSIKELLALAGALGAVGVIAVPAFNSQPQLPHKEAREVLLQMLPEIGEHAVKNKAVLLLEPLNRKEAYFLRQVADAASICRDADHPGIACMGDFWHMTWEETSDMGAFISAGKYLRHVHIASRKRRKMPGEDEGDNYVDGMRGLKMIGYQDYISLECGSVGDKNVTMPAAVKLMKEQWEIA
ncbi:MAG TPA: sugar phosphate isomerase/epimerase [bacterium]|nr:sugar phosphate isomerase/epimerase [bacterium]